MRGLDMHRRMGYAEASRILWGEALGTARSEKLGGGDFHPAVRSTGPPDELANQDTPA
jgi:hypothetical protein